MVQSTLDSLSTRTSITTGPVYTSTSLESPSVVTPSESLVGETPVVSTTGLSPTHGVPHGEKADSSGSSGDNAVLKAKSTHAKLNYETNNRMNVIRVILEFYFTWYVKSITTNIYFVIMSVF